MRYVALLRAVNVGGTGKLPMTDLKHMGEAAGFRQVSTYIASGNLLFASDESEAVVREALERALEEYAGRPVGVHVRTAEQLAQLVCDNPFGHCPPNSVAAILVDAPIPADALAGAKGRNDEEIRVGERVLFVHYPSGMGRSKLRIPAAADGTVRNMNTIAKLAELTARF